MCVLYCSSYHTYPHRNERPVQPDCSCYEGGFAQSLSASERPGLVEEVQLWRRSPSSTYLYSPERRSWRTRRWWRQRMGLKRKTGRKRTYSKELTVLVQLPDPFLLLAASQKPVCKSKKKKKKKKKSLHPQLCWQHQQH